MKFVSILKKLKQHALTNPLVHSVAIGDLYENLNGKLDIQYANINFDISSIQRNDNLITYQLYAYYTDRLLENKSNWAVVKESAETVLNSLINYASNEIGDVEDGYTITFFEQQFADYCAGGWVNFNLEVPNEMGDCEMDVVEPVDFTIEIYENGKFNVTDYTQAIVNVIPHWGTITGKIADQTDLMDLFETKQDVLTAGENITINGTTISAVDTVYDDTEIKGEISDIKEDISDIKEDISDVNETLDALDNFECGTIVPTTTNFVPETEYTIHEALQRTANLFGGFQGEIDDINELIPNQTTTQNQLADKAFVNSTVATNAANFRGSWNNWVSVPTNASQYPEDYIGNKKPTNNDYIVVQDASDYVSPEALAYKLTIVNLHATKLFTIGITDEYGVYKEYYYNDGFARTWKTISDEYSLYYESGIPGIWRIKTNKPEDTDIIKNGVTYSNAKNGIELLKTNDSAVPVIVGLPPQAGQYQGSWRFIYVGDWDTNGKLGWHPQYQIGSSFTAAQQAAIDSGITSTKVTKYDGYAVSITALQTDKLDKVYTANKIYGTDSLGTQISYTEGSEIAFANGNISVVGKQDTIPDLQTIREGAALGATALQSVPSEYVTDTELSSELSEYTTTANLNTILLAYQEEIDILKNRLIEMIKPEFVDLGLPSGTLWAKYNIGVDPFNLETPEDWYGNYYAWGEIKTKGDYSWSTYKYGNEYNLLTKYCPSTKPEYWGGIGNPDDLKTLLSSDDLATMLYQNPYRMPTKAEIEELLDTSYVDNEWVNDYQGVSGLNGVLFKSVYNGNEIFIPAAGFMSNDALDLDGSEFYLWSSEIEESYPFSSYTLHGSENNYAIDYYERVLGYSIRAVWNGTPI